MSTNRLNLQNASTFEAFKLIDKNKDSKVTAQEIRSAAKSADANKDGILNQTEAAKLGLSNPGDINKINQFLKNHTSSPQEVIFQAIRPNEVKFGLDQASEVLGRVTQQVPVSSDRYTSPEAGVVSFLGTIGVDGNRLLSGTLFGMGKIDSQKLEHIANITMMTRHGNCGELAATVAVEAKKAGAQRVELFSIPNHLFVVINREPNSDPKKPQTWGQNAIIMDPWMNDGKGETYFASKYRFRVAPQLEGRYIPSSDQRYQKSTTIQG